VSCLSTCLILIRRGKPSDVWITATNHECTITRATDAELAWIESFLSVPEKKFGRKFGTPDRVSLLNAGLRTFATGLLPLVIEEAAHEKHRVDIIDHRKRPCAPVMADLDWLSDYQMEAVEHGAEKARGVFHCPTGSGKTEIMVALGAVYPCRHLALVTSKDLLGEIQERFERRTGERCGVIGDGGWHEERFTVAMFQTLAARLRKNDTRAIKLLDSVDSLHIDEVHVVPAKTTYSVCGRARRAFFRFGYSATPFARSDKRGLLVIAATGPVIYRVEPRVLVAAGAVAKGRVRFIPTVQLPPAPVRNPKGKLATPTWVATYNEMIVKSVERNELVVRAARLAEKPSLLFVKELEHGRALTATLNKRGIPSEFVYGDKNVAQRKAAIRRLEHGDVDVLVVNTIFQVGVNIPTLRSVIHAAAGRSHIVALQNAGRGMRRRDVDGSITKDEFSVYDFADRGCGCRSKVDGVSRWAHMQCMWLEKHARERRRAYIGEQYEIAELRV
jgi:superfamily II DNA or RNA helicase